jgi:glycosyltransferase involved in cell wall biosynthesis
MIVSYVVTIYNKAPYIPYLLAGLSAQKGDFEREYIFVDDGSTDDSGNILRESTRGWSNVTIIHQDNAGPSLAFNRGIAVARGNLIKPIDGDDALMCSATMALINAMNSTGLPLAFGTCQPYSLGAVGGPDAVLKSADILYPRVTILSDSLNHSINHILSNPSGWIATTDIVKASGGCDARIFIQDVSIELRLAAISDFARIDAPIFFSPETAPGRLSDNTSQILHDCNLATAHFIFDHPDLPAAYRRRAMQRTLGCAWKWRHRLEKGSAFSSCEFWAFVGSYLGLPAPKREVFIKIACETFRRTHAIRLM